MPHPEDDHYLMILAVDPVTNSVVVGGLALAGLYALIAVGFTSIYRATRAVNFAQGAFMLVGAYLYWSFNGRLGMDQVESLLAVIGCSAALGVAVYWLVVRRMAGADEFIVIIMTLGLSLALVAAVPMIWGSNPEQITVGSNRLLTLLGFHFTLLELAALIISVVSIVAIIVVSKLTRWGVVMKSVAENPLLSGLYGINVDRVGALAWSIGTVLSGLAGVVFAAQTSLTLDVSSVGLIAFPAIMLGGMDSIGGAIVGGLLVGYAVTVVTTESNPTVADLSAYALLVVVLLVRPQGLFGRPAARRV